MDCRKACRNKGLLPVLLILFCVSGVLLGCQSREPLIVEEGKMTLSVSSSAFQDGSKIPAKYTCDGEDVSPPLAWGEVSQGTGAFALIVDDPDAPFGVWTHWVLYNLPPDTRELPEAVPTEVQLPSEALQGRNDFGGIGYGGPCPPGPGHHYRLHRLCAREAPGFDGWCL